MEQMLASVGRIVHYVSYGTPNGEYPSKCRAAIVSDVENTANPGEAPIYKVSLVVLNPEGMFFNKDVAYFDHVINDAPLKGGTWHWPERV